MFQRGGFDRFPEDPDSAARLNVRPGFRSVPYSQMHIGGQVYFVDVSELNRIARGEGAR